MKIEVEVLNILQVCHPCILRIDLVYCYDQQPKDVKTKGIWPFMKSMGQEIDNCLLHDYHKQDCWEVFAGLLNALLKEHVEKIDNIGLPTA